MNRCSSLSLRYRTVTRRTRSEAGLSREVDGVEAVLAREIGKSGRDLPRVDAAVSRRRGRNDRQRAYGNCDAADDGGEADPPHETHDSLTRAELTGATQDRGPRPRCAAARCRRG